MAYTLKQIIDGTVGIISSNISSLQAPKEVIYNRLDICRKCPHLDDSVNKITQKPNFKCGICGCFLRSKTKLNKEKCPKGFW